MYSLHNMIKFLAVYIRSQSMSQGYQDLHLMVLKVEDSFIYYKEVNMEIAKRTFI